MSKLKKYRGYDLVSLGTACGQT